MFFWRKQQIHRALVAALVCLFFPAVRSAEPMPSANFPNLPAIRRAAEEGDARAQFKLGDFFFSHADYTNAVMWYRRAAEQGMVEAQISLASCYATGRGVPKDLQRAARWSRLASRQYREATIQLRTDDPPLIVQPAPQEEPRAPIRAAADNLPILIQPVPEVAQSPDGPSSLPAPGPLPATVAMTNPPTVADPAPAELALSSVVSNAVVHTGETGPTAAADPGPGETTVTNATDEAELSAKVQERPAQDSASGEPLPQGSPDSLKAAPSDVPILVSSTNESYHGRSIRLDVVKPAIEPMAAAIRPYTNSVSR